MKKTEFGKQLQKVRMKKKLTQKEIAEKINIAEQAWQRYEYGKIEPKIIIMIKLAEKLNISMDYLTGRTEDDSPFYKDDETNPE